MPGEGFSVSSKEPIEVRPPGHARCTRMRPSSKMTSANTAKSFPKSPWPTREQKAPLSGIQDCCASESWPPPPWVSFTSLSVSHPIWNLRGRCNPVFRLGSCRKCENTDCAKDGGEERGLHFLENVEVWHRLPGAPLSNRVKGCNHEGHFDLGRVAGCPPPSCVCPAWARCKWGSSPL